MRLLRKAITAFFVIAISSVVFAVPAAFAASGTYVFDEYGVLSSSEVQQLDAKAKDIAEQYNTGAYLLITDDMGSSSPSASERNNFARRYYDQKGLGVGSDKSGIIFVVAVGSRDYVAVKKYSSDDPFSDKGIDKIEEDVRSYLSDNRWYDAGKSYYNDVDEQLNYYAATGKQWTETDLVALLLKLLAILGIPGVVAGTIVSGEKRAMKTAGEQVEASDYLDRSSFNVTEATDQFVNTTLVATPRPKKSDSGGSGWSDMGGGFSGSGGGKF